MTTAERSKLLTISMIYHEASVPEYARGREILDRFAGAERIVVPSHWNIPELHGNADLVSEWNTVKRTVLVLGVKKGLQIRPFYRSADFIAPSTANGCAMACSYCYVGRRKGSANPITTFVNIEAVSDAIAKHAAKQGMKLEPTQPDPDLWVYELGTNSDLAVDAMVSDNVRDLVRLFRELPNAKATFATKYVNRDLLGYDPQNRTRLRFSVMPRGVSRLVDVRTSPVEERIAAVNEFVDAGYEVNFNFGPVIVYDGWLRDWVALFDEIDDVLSPRAKQQLAAEIIFLTHSEQLHELNMHWHPKAETLLWRPDLQEAKTSQMGAPGLRYRMDLKRGFVRDFRALLAERLPYCTVRYAF